MQSSQLAQETIYSVELYNQELAAPVPYFIIQN